MSNIFRVDLLERYTYLLCVRLCQDATNDLLNTVDIEVMEKGGIFGYRDRRSFVNFNKWRRNGKNGKRKEEEWKEKMEGREFYGSKIFYSSIKVSYARRGKKKKVS